MCETTRTGNGNRRYGTMWRWPCTDAGETGRTSSGLLGEKGIDVVFRGNENGRIYGVTFIDHRNREAYNGSRLGKEFSANVFEQLFNRPQEFPEPEVATDNMLANGRACQTAWKAPSSRLSGYSVPTSTAPTRRRRHLPANCSARKKKNAVYEAYPDCQLPTIKILQLCNKKMI